MSKQKVLISYAKLRTDALLTKCKEILQSMGGNISFPNPNPAVADYETLIASFEDAILTATTGNKLAVAQRNTLQNEVLLKTKALGQYVNSIAEGKLDMLTSSGFTLGKLPEPRIIGNPTNLQVVQGTNPGSLLSKVPAVAGAITYIHQFAQHPLTENSVWTSATSSRSRYEFEDLEQGKMYWFRVIAIGSNDQKTYSEETSQYVSQRTLNLVA
jgi:hypothetical protein